MKPKKLTTKLLSLSCEKSPDVMPRILTMLTRPGYVVESISQARTDVAEIVLITIEVAIPGKAIDNMIRRLNRIIGVLDVTVSFGSALQSAIYRVAASAGEAVWRILYRHNAKCIEVQNNGHMLIHQVASVEDIQRLYNELDGPSLLGFSQLPVAISQPLSWDALKSMENNAQYAGVQ